MFKIEGDTIHLTRGDAASIGITIEQDEETTYEFQIGDVIRFSIYEKGNYNNVKLRKDIEVTQITEEVELELISEETKLDDIINKIKTYWYEIELNPDTDNTQTIIGYDEDGAKLFILYPEGVDNYVEA